MNGRLDIAFFGSSLVSSYWNGAATYYRGIIRALAAQGHRVTFYEPDALGRQQHRDIPDPPWARVAVYPATQAGVIRSLEQARRATLVVKASGVGVFDELLEREVLALQNARTHVAFWDVDAPATLARVETNAHDPLRTLIPRFDLILTYGGGPKVVSAYRRLGARDCVPVYNALDPVTHFPVPPEKRFDGLLAFLGNRMPDREARIEEFFFKPARRLAPARFLLGGSGWEPRPELPNLHCLNHVGSRDHNAFNASPRAVLNVNRESMAHTGWSPPTRVFEAAGSAACLITDAWEGIEQFFEPGREVLIAHNGDEVADCLQHLTPRRAAKLGRAAFKRVRAEHTYAQRAQQLQRVFEDHFDLRKTA